MTDTFEIRPYGWPLPAVLCNLAKLCGRGKLEARSDSEVLEEKELWDAITNTRIHGNVLLEPQIEFTQGQVRRLKEFYEQFFDSSPKSTKAKALGAETVSGFELMRHELKLLIARSSQFPFLSSLADHDGQFTCFAKKSYKLFFTEFEAESETLLDLKENVLDPIRKFMSGPQANLYADANAFLESNSPNFSYLDGTEVEKIKSLLADPKCYVSNAAQQIKQLHDSLKAKLLKKTTEETQVASAAIQSKADRIQSIEGYSLLSADQQSEIRTTFTNAIAAISSQPLIAVVRETVRNFETVAYQKLLTKVGEWTAKPDPKPIEPSTVSKPGVDPIPRKVVQYHSIPPLHVAYDRAWLASPSDIDEYLAAMKASMLKVVRDGDRVQV